MIRFCDYKSLKGLKIIDAINVEEFIKFPIELYGPIKLGLSLDENGAIQSYTTLDRYFEEDCSRYFSNLSEFIGRRSIRTGIWLYCEDQDCLRDYFNSLPKANEVSRVEIPSVGVRKLLLV